MFEPIQDFLVKVSAKKGIKKEFEAIKVCNEFRKIVPKIFSNFDTASSHIIPAYYRDFSLMIEADSPAFCQEVFMRKEKIIDEMNSRMGRKVVRELKTRLRRAGSLSS